jgi:predicted SnoaL-like aldol condensation-catalyzing enzyme
VVLQDSERRLECAPLAPQPDDVQMLARTMRVREVHATVGSFTNGGEAMSNATSKRNKAIVLEACQALFNKRDYKAAERFWSPNYIQHSAHIPAGRDGLLGLIRNLPPTLKYEPGVIVADGDYVIIHGRFSGMGLPANWIAADVVRLKDGILVEHWDVIQDESTKEQSKSGNPMFGDAFPK